MNRLFDAQEDKQLIGSLFHHRLEGCGGGDRRLLPSPFHIRLPNLTLI